MTNPTEEKAHSNKLQIALEALEVISDRDPCNNVDGLVGECLFNPPCIGCTARAAIQKARGM